MELYNRVERPAAQKALYPDFRMRTSAKWHFYVGYLVLALLEIRLVWGVVDPAPARFRFIEADDYFEEAPLYGYVSGEVSDFMNTIHHPLPDVILILVILHVGAIVYYLVWKRENRILPIIHGWKRVRRQ